MVKNGYILNVSTKELPAFFKVMRKEIKEVIKEPILMQIAKEAEKLYDMKFVEQAKYSDSIFNCAMKTVAQRISGVALGAYRDPLFDYRATLIIAKPSKDHRKQYVILNTENAVIKHYFEHFEVVEDFKFDRFIDEDLPDDVLAANTEHGQFWHKVFDEHNWNLSMVGYAAQLSVQPDIMAMGFSAEDLEPFFSPPEMRCMDYVKRSVTVNKVRELIGSTPIEKINPYTLTEFFERAFLFLDTEAGEDECFLLDEKVKKGFCNVDISLLSVSE